MRKTVLSMLSAALVAGFASTALAFHCPADMRAIDAALAKSPSLGATQIAEVTKLRASGKAKHQAGDHAGSVADLGKAMELLGIK